MQPTTIIGTGLAGYTTAREFRKLDAETPLRLISVDDGASYSKPMLSNAVARGQSAESLVMKSATAMADQLGAEILTDARVTALDCKHKTLKVGEADLGYSKLVLALGADPITLPLQGSGAKNVLSVNDLGDYARFRHALEGKKRIAILGAGLIGCEFANDLSQGGYRVELIDLAPLPLGRLVPAEVGKAMQDGLTALGVGWHLATSVASVDAIDGGRLLVKLDNGETLEVDLMLSAIGLRPRSGLAGAAGLEVDRGVVVDEFLRSSDDDVYALGDCAQVGGLVLPYVMPIMQCARALGRTLAGQPSEVSYPAMPVAVKTPALPVVVCPPLPGVAGKWRSTADDDGIRAFFTDSDGTLRGFALSGAAVADKNTLAGRLPAWL